MYPNKIRISNGEGQVSIWSDCKFKRFRFVSN